MKNVIAPLMTEKKLVSKEIETITVTRKDLLSFPIMCIKATRGAFSGANNVKLCTFVKLFKTIISVF